MPLDPRAQRLLSMLAAARPDAPQRPTPSERRQSLIKLMQFARTERGDVMTSDGTLPGPAGDLRYRLYAPAALTGPAPGFVFFHGGGLVAGSIDTHDPIAAGLSAASGCRVVSIDYRLAPEHPFPAAIDDAIAATAFIARNATRFGIDSDRLVVGGDSAGATLAAVVCQDAVLNNGHAIAVQCLICPVLDSAQNAPSRDAFADDQLIGKATLQADLADYAPDGTDLADARISPLRATTLAGLPAAIIHTSEFDPMRDEGNAYAERLQSAGVTVDHVCHAGMVHNFHAMGKLLPQAQIVLSQIGQQVRHALEATPTR